VEKPPPRPAWTPPPRPPDLEAEITFVTTAEGGRKGPAYSGYRPQFFYDGHDWDALQEYPNVEQVLPGDRVTARLWLISPDAHRGRVAVGMRFDLREGQRVVARGVVTRLVAL
jgi:translation elongation factor EF-Tu-like GTPase